MIDLDPDLDLRLDRVMHAPRARVWTAWTDPRDLARWWPADPAPVAMTAEVTLSDHPRGTDYRVLVRHADAGSRRRHEQLGFADGWGTVTSQLATIVESEKGHR